MIIVKYRDVYCRGSNYPYQEMCEPKWIDVNNNNVRFYVLCATCNWVEVAELETCRAEIQTGARCKKQVYDSRGLCNTHAKEEIRKELNRSNRWLNQLEVIDYAQMTDLLDKYETYVYVMGANGFVKIGYSKDPNSRLKSLKSLADKTLVPTKVKKSDIKIIKMVKGNFRLEQVLHRLCARSHSIGEWFRHDSHVAGIIDLLDDDEKIAALLLEQDAWANNLQSLAK